MREKYGDKIRKLMIVTSRSTNIWIIASLIIVLLKRE